MRARAILDRHMLQPVGLVVTGMRGGSRYGYEAYGPTEPPLVGEAEVVPPLAGRRRAER
jgi:hypothetical protein